MAIAVGDRIPDAQFTLVTKDGHTNTSTAEYFQGRTVALVGVPGAFTPTCSAKHLPGFVEQASALKAKGVDAIACMSVNDAFVMDAWGKDQGVGENVELIADGDGSFAQSLGLQLNTGSFGGPRVQRFSAVVENGVVRQLNVEEGGAFEVSGAEKLLEQL